MSQYSQAQLDALNAALAKGVKSVSYDGQTVTYRSVAEMERIKASMERDLGQRATRVRTYAGFERGT